MEFQKQSSSIRTLSLDAANACSPSSNIAHPPHRPTNSLITSMATHTPQESMLRDKSSTGERPLSRQGSSPPPLFIPPPPPSIWIACTASEVKSPLNSQSNLSLPDTTPTMMSPLAFPIPMTSSPSLLSHLLESSSSHRPLRRSVMYGSEPFLCALGQQMSNPEVLLTLLKRISSSEGQASTPSPQSSLSGFEGAVSRYTPHHSPTPTPTPSEVEADLTCFPPSPPESNTL